MNVCVPSSWHDAPFQPFATLWQRVLDTGHHPAVRLARLATGYASIAARPVAQHAGVALVVDREGKSLVDACVAGDPAARRRFHTDFLPLIYRFEGGGQEHEGASHDFLGFLFDEDRLYRRLQSFRGAAPLGTYLWSYILPDLLKQFRTMIRRQRLDTVSLDEHASHFTREPTAQLNDTDCEAPAGAVSLLAQLPLDKRLLFKLLYIEDFDLEAAEIQRLAEHTGRSVREVLERIEAAREVVRSREAVQRTRLDAAESAGQWIRLYKRRLAQLEEDLVALDPNSPGAQPLGAQRAEIVQKLDKRRRQRVERLRSSSHTVVTLPTEMLADLLGQPASSTRSHITRERQELAALLSHEAGRHTAAEGRC